MDTEDLKVVRLEGGPGARGRMHGELFRDRIAELLERWGDSLERGYGVDRRRYVELFFESTDYEATTARLAPAILDEVRGIAEGSGAPHRELLAFQHVNEEFEWAPLFAKRAPAVDGEACSTIVVPPGGGRPSRIAQNLDLAQFLDGFQVLLRGPCDAGDGEVMALSVPGMISLMGMNSHGFAVCDNTLTQLRTDPMGLPIYAIYRLLLESRSLEEARGLVDRTPHAVGLNWVMGDPDGVAMIERSAGVSTPYAQARAAWHTNHPLVCEDWSAARGRPSRSSHLRLAALHQRLQGTGDLGAAELEAVLASRDDADYPVSRGGGTNLEDQQIGFTLACNIFELKRGDPRWRLAAGPPHETAFREFGFD
jgi:isopenicillin-N N-acyltransferase-like protein